MGWPGLVRFWLALLTLLGSGAIALQIVSPPGIPAAVPVVRADPMPVSPGPQAPSAQGNTNPALVAGAGIAEPDPALLEAVPGLPRVFLPKIAADGRKPMDVYAIGFDRLLTMPRVGLLVTGIGMGEAESLDAINRLPGAIALGISAYATDVTALLEAVRKAGHEYVLSVPMEPLGYPLNDPDNRLALMTSLSPAENLKRLRVLMGRASGYVGVTDAFGPMNGAGLLGLPEQRDPVLAELAQRGLLFVDTTSRQGPARSWTRSIDIVLDEDGSDRTTLDSRLETLIRMATDNGAALGLVSVPRPVTIQRIAAWSRTLAARGVVLAPVTGLALPPAASELDQPAR